MKKKWRTFNEREAQAFRYGTGVSGNKKAGVSRLAGREEDFAQLKRDVNKIDDFLKRELGLVLHPKKRYCQPVRRGMSFLGARIYPYCLFGGGGY